MRPRVMCWQDYSPDCCRGGYTTIIIRRYLIHFIRVLKYLGAVFILWCSCHTKPHIWCVSSQHKQLNVSLFFRSNLPTNCSRFTWVYYTFSTSSRWLWILKYYNICFLPLLSHPICSQLWLLFKWRKKLLKRSHTPTVRRRKIQAWLQAWRSVSQSDCADTDQPICADEMSAQ